MPLASLRRGLRRVWQGGLFYVLLVHLPGAHDAPAVAQALMRTIQTLPGHLRRSLTWDRGTEMTRHAQVTLATDMAWGHLPLAGDYFCDPHSPWQRGSNENTNGLLRQYFPRGTDLSVHSEEHLAAVAAELNGRPRKTLGWSTPAEAMNRLLSDPASQSLRRPFEPAMAWRSAFC